MTDCQSCSKIFSKECSKTCVQHQAELASYWQECENHVHHMARVIWRLQPDRSKLSEIDNNMVSSITPQTPPTPFDEATTQAGHLSYPNVCFNTSPACKLAPIRADVVSEEDTAYLKSHIQPMRSVCGVIPQGAPSYQDAEYDLSVMDGKHDRTGRRQGSTRAQAEEHGGSNPTHPIPTSLDTSFLSVHGAGNFFQTTNPHSACADYNYQR